MIGASREMEALIAIRMAIGRVWKERDGRPPVKVVPDGTGYTLYVYTEILTVGSMIYCKNEGVEERASNVRIGLN